MEACRCVCGSSGSLRCSACKTVKYCSRTCQKHDWANHKKTCKNLAQEKYKRKLVGAVVNASNGPQCLAESLPALQHFSAFWLYPEQELNHNLVIYLGGLGDKLQPYIDLATKFSFPDTSSLVLGGTCALPLKDMGYGWYKHFDEQCLVIDPGKEDQNQLNTFLQTRKALHMLLDQLIQIGFESKYIFLFGYGQGGTSTIDCACTYPKSLGGAISISGEVFYATVYNTAVMKQSTESKSTPIISTFGDRSLNSEEYKTLERAKTNFERVCGISDVNVNTIRRLYTFPKNLVDMIRSKEETTVIMEFLGKRMYSSSTKMLEKMSKNGDLIQIK